jgi:hypothetical protein
MKNIAISDDIQSRMDQADLLIKEGKQAIEIYQTRRKIRARKQRIGRRNRGEHEEHKKKGKK